MKTSILAIGTELLGTSRLDTNSLKITSLLEQYGIGINRKSVVGDSLDEIIRELRFAASGHDLLILTGGLGPTEDDLTKESVARAFQLELEESSEILRSIEERFARRGLRMSPLNARQAQIFAGHETLINNRGTAPGFHLTVTFEGSERHIWVFPGVPYELEGMLENDFGPWIRSQRGEVSRVRRILKIIGMPESTVDEQLGPFYKKHGIPFTILASHGEVQIHLQADGDRAESGRTIAAMEAELRETFGERMFGVDDDSIEEVVGRLLTNAGATLSTAESCTGGLLASRLTDVAGSSRYFVGGAVAYSAQLKLSITGVDPANIAAHGEVSEQVARDMASGVRRRFNTTYGVGITGIAGPGGGSDEKPVGTVHISVASESEVKHRKALFSGSRELIKYHSTQAALDMLRLFVLRGR